MNCNDVANGIYVYLDGEFAEPEVEDFRRHLAACERCRRLADDHRSFLSCLKESMAAPPSPPHLKARIERGLAAAGPPLPVEHDVRRGAASAVAPWWGTTAPLAVAAGFVAVLGWGVWTAAAANADDPLARGAVQVHQRDLPMEVRGSEAQIREFLQDNVPFAVSIPFPAEGATRLVGARLTRVGDDTAVLFNYEIDGDRVSVLQLPDAPDETPTAQPEPKVAAHEGFKVVTFRHQGVQNSVVGDLGERRLLRLIPASFRP